MGTDENPDNKQNIADLADKIMGLGGANVFATVKHWARFAVMVCTVCCGDFWGLNKAI